MLAVGCSHCTDTEHGRSDSVVPIYVLFALVAPLVKWTVGRAAFLDAPEARATAFSAVTRNLLVVLPLAFAVPGAVPLLPVVIVTQTVVELMALPAYMKAMPLLGRQAPAA
jgi:ACR3 family arsenite efflux pump ArsB